MSVGTVLRIWTLEGDSLAVDPKHDSEVDAKWGQWVEREIDAKLRLATSYGDEVQIRASDISKVLLSTPEGRKTATQLEAIANAEQLDNEKAAGLKEPWETGDEPEDE